MAYPSSIDTFANPAGTNTLSSPDHAADHNNLASAIQAVENTLGTTAASGIISGWASGQVPVKSKGGTLQQEVIGGTLTTPTIAGGTMNSGVFGTPTIKVGSDATGDLLYNAGAGLVGRIAIGAAGAFLKSNGTNPIWGTTPAFVAGGTTYDATTTANGTIVTTFQPRLAIAISSKQSAAAKVFSVGFTDGTTSANISITPSGTVYNSGELGVVWHGEPGTNSIINFSSFGTGNFVFSRTVNNTPSGSVTFNYLLVG